MQIILTKEEYDAMKPSEINNIFVKDVIDIISNTEDFDIQSSFQDLRSRVRRYERDLKKESEFQ